jgi:ribose transport system permease protein
MSEPISIQEKFEMKAKRKKILSSMLPFVGLIFITVLLTIGTNGALLKESNLMSLVNQCFTICIVSVGAAFVYAHGGMDFSIGASCGLAQFICVIIMVTLGLPIYVGIIASILIGVSVSTMVGTISILLKVPVFVTSLCLRAVCVGLLAVGTNSVNGKLSIDYQQFSVFNDVILKFGILIAVILVGYFLFEKTSLGKNQKAIGGNINTAVQAGIRVNKNMIIAYSILGFCVGLAAFFALTRFGSVTASAGSGLEFDTMIALVLGGFPLSGGTASRIRAAVVGSITITILSNGLILWGIDVNLVNGLKGLLCIVIIALSYDRSTLKQVSLLPAS